MRVDSEDLLLKAEQFFERNVDKLNLLVLGQSQLYQDCLAEACIDYDIILLFC